MAEDITGFKVDPTPTGQHVMLPPSNSLVNTVLNGVGNGMTIGAIPIGIAEAHALWTKKDLTKPQLVFNFALLATGAAIGAFFGVREAKQITNYRQSLNDEINKLHDETAVNNGKIEALTNAIAAREQAKNPDAAR